MELSTDIWVGALIRRAELGGAFAMVARKGDPRAGAVLVKTVDRRHDVCRLYARAVRGDSIPPAGDDETHPILIAMIGLAMVVLLPLVWGLIRRTQGLPMFGSPTVAELEDPAYRPGIVGMRKADAPAGRGD